MILEHDIDFTVEEPRLGVNGMVRASLNLRDHRIFGPETAASRDEAIFRVKSSLLDSLYADVREDAQDLKQKYLETLRLNLGTREYTDAIEALMESIDELCEFGQMRPEPTVVDRAREIADNFPRPNGAPTEHINEMVRELRPLSVTPEAWYAGRGPDPLERIRPAAAQLTLSLEAIASIDAELAAVDTTPEIRAHVRAEMIADETRELNSRVSDRFAEAGARFGSSIGGAIRGAGMRWSDIADREAQSLIRLSFAEDEPTPINLVSALVDVVEEQQDRQPL